MQIAGSAIASSVTYLTPVVAVIVGIIFLGEKITWNEPAGALVVLLGAAIAQERLKLAKR
jgi:drug/metabolite transporter (DMT)-like permease